MAYERELDVCMAAARRAGENALQYQRKGITAESKSDLSPVTIADKTSEQIISRMLLEAFPEDGLLGEEGARSDGASGRRWIIDPIDGTREFVRGVPTWSVLIGLEEAGQVKVGVAHFPGLNETYWATRGGGAFRDGAPIRSSSISDPAQAVLCSNSKDLFLPQRLEASAAWLRQFWSVRSFGGCLDAALVASGRAEVWLELSAKAWDLAALSLIGQEAGAVFLNLNGGTSIHEGHGLLCVPGLEAEVRRFVKCLTAA